eukprot:jgi/Undpi1/1874/HiC_scaffold_12.g05261.m1
MMHQDMLMLEGASTGPVIGDRFDFLDIFFSYQPAPLGRALELRTTVAEAAAALRNSRRAFGRASSATNGYSSMWRTASAVDLRQRVNAPQEIKAARQAARSRPARTVTNGLSYSDTESIIDYGSNAGKRGDIIRTGSGAIGGGAIGETQSDTEVETGDGRGAEMEFRRPRRGILSRRTGRGGGREREWREKGAGGREGRREKGEDGGRRGGGAREGEGGWGAGEGRGRREGGERGRGGGGERGMGGGSRTRRRRSRKRRTRRRSRKRRTRRRRREGGKRKGRRGRRGGEKGGRRRRKGGEGTEGEGEGTEGEGEGREVKVEVREVEVQTEVQEDEIAEETQEAEEGEGAREGGTEDEKTRDAGEEEEEALKGAGVEEEEEALKGAAPSGEEEEGGGKGSQSEVASEVPTEVPSEAPSEVPFEVPSDLEEHDKDKEDASKLFAESIAVGDPLLLPLAVDTPTMRRRRNRIRRELEGGVVSTKPQEPTRQLTPYLVEEVEGEGFGFRLTVFRCNKQGDIPVQKQCGVYDTAYEAERAAESFSSPIWQDHASTSKCSECRQTFHAIFARLRHHCRNCGRLVCSNCAGSFWVTSNMPSTYQRESSRKKVRVCCTCFTARWVFRNALLKGNYDRAMAAFGTGCVNLRVPYSTFIEYPVHCAAAGGSVEILSWLMEDRCCPVFKDRAKTVALVDKKGRSVMAVAAESGQLATMRYLALTQPSLLENYNNMAGLRRGLTACLNYDDTEKSSPRGQPHATRGECCYTYGADWAPAPAHGGGGGNAYGGGGGGDSLVNGWVEVKQTAKDKPEASVLDAAYSTYDLPGGGGGGGGAAVGGGGAGGSDEDGGVDPKSVCIMCFNRKVNCTLVPCGHHCCCLTCAEKFDKCPVCRLKVARKIKAIDA